MSIEVGFLRAALPGASALPLALAALLVACGGGGEGLPSGDAASPTDARPTALASIETTRSTPAMPIDHAARPAHGGVLSRGEAERLEAEQHGDVVWVDVRCCPGDEQLPVLIAYGVQAANNLDASAPILVTGGDLRLAARVVDRLGAERALRAYLVMP